MDPYAEKERDQALLALIEAIDHCDHALAQKSLHNHELAGVKLVRDGLIRAALSSGMREVSPPIGQVFDPHAQEAIGMREGGQENCIAEIATRGWQHRGKTLRVAKVFVYNGAADASSLPKGRQGRRAKGT